MTPPVLEVAGLTVTFPGAGGPVPVVRGVDYAVAPGEVLGIVGESGSGKSVTALAVMGLLPPRATMTGSVRLHGEELAGAPERRLTAVRGRTISMVFQDPLSALTPVYRVGDQIAEAIRAHRRIGAKEAERRAVELLDLVGIPSPRQRALAFPHEFSGGMRQRVMIAMAVANDPDVIICDEPTTALDVTVQAQVLEVLRTAQRETGAAIVMITHDLGVVAGLADRVLVMYAGRVVEAGRVDDVYHRARMPYTRGLLGSVPRLDGGRARLAPIDGTPPSPGALPPGCPFEPRCPAALPECREAEPPLVAAGGPGQAAACVRAAEPVADPVADPAEAAEAAGADPGTAAGRADGRPERAVVLRVDGLVKHHPLVRGAVLRRRVGTVRAVDGVTFDVREGETLGLVGESGCGKTTTLMQILELAAPQRGTIAVLGRDTARLRAGDRTAIRRDLQVVFQDPLAALDPRMTVHDILAEPLRAHGRPPGPRVRELLGLVGLEAEHAGRYPREFSGGQRQRIGIARALALEPRLVVLDEPVSALDVSIQAGVVNLLAELKERLGLSYLFVAHDLAVVRHIADRVAVMHLGRIAEIGQVDRVYAAPAHPYTQALLSAVPLPDPARERARRRILLEGDLPNPASPPSGCRFRTRCPRFTALGPAERDRCVREEPEVRLLGGDQGAACHYAERVDVM
ncbi:putative ABC transporter ATP-binding protein [Microtetraspora sp. NBRC 13810]|uniref:ABC transporter ATP-binding protein n=1 Tax=Microtetraspora sp. NBRC 13810 TaxID=3030990 RepID=UPI0024A241CD|nr:ABC transporter ATP-binding protein [Microtetraspora sp. NBRC 13810]GLW07954.1 putative ABC transporter ATP-binding protein [Microtetraspora sp. NBRC 13810]